MNSVIINFDNSEDMTVSYNRLKKLYPKNKITRSDIESDIDIDERLIAALEKSNPKEIALNTDENENILIDKELPPHLYDWAVNG